MKDSPAMKSDLRRLERRLGGRLDSLDAKIDAKTGILAKEIIKTNERMDRLEASLRAEMRELKDTVVTALDASVKRMESLWQSSAFIPLALDAHGAQLRAHEARLTRLESRF